MRHHYLLKIVHYIKFKLNSTREKILEKGFEAVKYAKKFVNDVELNLNFI